MNRRKRSPQGDERQIQFWMLMQPRSERTTFLGWPTHITVGPKHQGLDSSASRHLDIARPSRSVRARDASGLSASVMLFAFAHVMRRPPGSSRSARTWSREKPNSRARRTKTKRCLCSTAVRQRYEEAWAISRCVRSSESCRRSPRLAQKALQWSVEALSSCVIYGASRGPVCTPIGSLCHKRSQSARWRVACDS
jgi:hypothetical protein